MQQERKTLRPRSAFRSLLVDGGARFGRRETYDLPLSGSIPDISTYSFSGPREVGASEGLTERGVTSLGKTNCTRALSRDPHR